MPMNEVIRTSGDIRRFIAQTMTGVRSGDIAVERGLCIAALAKEITSSMQVEVNVAKVRISMLDSSADLGKITPIGHLLIEQDGTTPTIDGTND